MIRKVDISGTTIIAKSRAEQNHYTPQNAHTNKIIVYLKTYVPETLAFFIPAIMNLEKK